MICPACTLPLALQQLSLATLKLDKQKRMDELKEAFFSVAETRFYTFKITAHQKIMFMSKSINNIYANSSFEEE